MIKDALNFNGKIYKIQLDDGVAYKDKKIYPVYTTINTVLCANCIGVLKFVFNENDELISVAYPLSRLDNDFEYISKEQLQYYEDIVSSYKQYKKGN